MTFVSKNTIFNHNWEDFCHLKISEKIG